LANQVPDEALAAIEEGVRRYPGGVSAPEILRVLATPVPPRTLQYRLKHLVTQNRVVMDGAGRWPKYRTSRMISAVPQPSAINNTIRARHTCFRGTFRSAAIASSWIRSVALTSTLMPVRIAQTRISAR
jgi:hypothetical protein